MTTTTTATTTGEDFAAAAAEAEEEAREAEQLVETLEERVREGDETVDFAQIEAQRSLSGFAKLRAEAARRKAERADAERRQASADEVRRAVAAFLADPEMNTAGMRSALDDLGADVEAAVQKFLDRVSRRRAAVDAIIATAREAGAPMVPFGEGGSHGPIWMSSGGTDGIQVIVDRTHHVGREHPLASRSSVKETLGAALRRASALTS